MIKSPSSLAGTGYLSVLITILIIAPTIGFVWIWSEYTQTNRDIDTLKSTYIARQEKFLTNDADNILKFIDYKRSNTRKRLKKIIKDRVHSAYSMAAHIHSMQRETASLEDIKFEIKEHLRPIRWDNGAGYFFILDHQGTARLIPDRPEIEGKIFLEARDAKGTPFIKEMIDQVFKNDSSFYSYEWVKPGEQGATHQKLIYGKHFKPAQWIIGTGYYVDDMEKTIKTEVLERIEGVKDRENHYTFIIQDNGFCLFHPDKEFQGKNLLDQPSPAGKRAVQEIIAQVKQKGSGLIQYPWKKPGTGNEVDSIGYAFAINNWNWIMVKGVFLDDVQKTIATKKAQLKHKQRQDIFFIISMTCAAIAVSLMFGWVVTRRMQSGIQAFYDFFQQAAYSHIRIDQKKLIFKEFKMLGTLANQMVDDWTAKAGDLEKAMAETINLQHLLKNITDSMPSMLMAVDKELNIIQWNRAAAKGTRTPAARALGQPITRVVALSDPEISIIKEVLRRGIPHTGVRQPGNHSSQKRHESLTIYPLVSDQITGAVIQIDDITEKIRMEEMMIQSEKMLSVGGLAAGMAHEINNPLAGISQNTALLENRLFGDLPPNVKAARECHVEFDQIKAYARKRNLPATISNISTAVSRAAKIVNDMLSFSRMSTCENQYSDLADLMDKTIQLAATSYDLKNRYDFKKIDIHRHYAPVLPEIKCDAGKIQQVFLNLLVNGAHAMYDSQKERPPRFDICISHADGWVVIEIEDNGPGMTAQVKKRIFEPFYTTKELGVGTGLGLSVSYFIITHQHHGTLEVFSRPHAGARFKIRLPAETGHPAR